MTIEIESMKKELEDINNENQDLRKKLSQMSVDHV